MNLLPWRILSEFHTIGFCSQTQKFKKTEPPSARDMVLSGNFSSRETLKHEQKSLSFDGIYTVHSFQGFVLIS